MKPIYTKEEKIDLNGNEVTVVGKVYEQPLPGEIITEFGPMHSCVDFFDWRGGKVHPGFTYPNQMTEFEIENEVKHHARNIKEKPNAYGL